MRVIFKKTRFTSKATIHQSTAPLLCWYLRQNKIGKFSPHCCSNLYRTLSLSMAVTLPDHVTLSHDASPSVDRMRLTVSFRSGLGFISRHVDRAYCILRPPCIWSVYIIDRPVDARGRLSTYYVRTYAGRTKTIRRPTILIIFDNMHTRSGILYGRPPSVHILPQSFFLKVHAFVRRRGKWRSGGCLRERHAGGRVVGSAMGDRKPNTMFFQIENR